MVAYAYAQAYRDEVAKLVVVDAPLPGTTVFDALRTDPRVWHFAFHAVRDLPEHLVAGREREYLRFFFDARTSDPSALDLDVFAAAYEQPGAMRAGFELYRAFDQDAEDNRAALAAAGKLTIPVLAVGGEKSTSGALVEAMMREVAEDVTGVIVPGTAHWVPEEQPEAFAARPAGVHEYVARMAASRSAISREHSQPSCRHGRGASRRTGETAHQRASRCAQAVSPQARSCAAPSTG